MFDLIRSTCVSHEWGNNIASSSKLQRKLFLAPEPVRDDDRDKWLIDWSRTWMADDDDTITDTNTRCPYVALRDLSKRERDYLVRKNSLRLSAICKHFEGLGEDIVTPVRIHPLLQPAESLHIAFDLSGQFTRILLDRFKLQESVSESWENMLPCQPPAALSSNVISSDRC